MNVAQIWFQLLRRPLFVCVVTTDEVEGWVSDQRFNHQQTQGNSIVAIVVIDPIEKP